jgi:hypothetical protein
MTAYEGVELQTHSFLTSVLCALSGQLHALAALTLEKKTPVRTAQEPQWTLRRDDKFLGNTIR